MTRTCDHRRVLAEAGPSVLVVAAWHDSGRLVARVTRTEPGNESGKTSVVLVGKRLVLDTVAEWLETLEPDVTGPS
jgi:hypothetical protein